MNQVRQISRHISALPIRHSLVIRPPISLSALEIFEGSGKVGSRARRHFSSSSSDPPATLYQYAICPYCNISKALLHYTQTPYEAVEVNPLNKAELKSLPDATYKKVPILFRGKEQHQINGSEEIVESILLEHPSIDSSSDSAIKWTAFARDDLAPLLYPNLCNSLGNAYQAFGYVHSTPSFSMAQRYSIQFLGSIAMYFAASKIKKKRNIVDEKEALRNALESLDAGLEEGGYLSDTTKPNLGDLTTYGVLRGLEGLTVMDVLDDYPKIQSWFSKMKQVVDEKR